MENHPTLALGIDKAQNFIFMIFLNVANEGFTAIMITLKAIPKTKRTGVSPVFAFSPVDGQLSKRKSFFTATYRAWQGQAIKKTAC